MYLLNCFFIYSVLGYFLEMFYGMANGVAAESGFLYGPWTPIYGIASVLIILISDKLFKSLHMNRIIETVIVMIVLTILLTGLEWLGGVLIELFFGYSFWDYTAMNYNFGKYVCLEFAFLWSTMSVLFIYVIHPVLEQIISKIPKFLTLVVSILFIVDLFVTFYLNWA